MGIPSTFWIFTKAKMSVIPGKFFSKSVWSLVHVKLKAQTKPSKPRVTGIWNCDNHVLIMREKHCKKTMWDTRPEFRETSWTCTFLWGNDGSFVMDFHGKIRPKSQPTSKFGWRNSEGTKNVGEVCFFLVFWLIFCWPQVACYKQHLTEFHGGFHAFVWKSLRCRLFTCLACSALVPTWRWRWPKKRKERGKNMGWLCGSIEDVEKNWRFFSWGFQMDIYHIFLFTHTYIIIII